MAEKRAENRLTISVKEAADMLGISRNLGYTLAREGKLPGVLSLGRKRLVVSKAAIEKLLQAS
jgi:excisionase family DNA binding protein